MIRHLITLLLLACPTVLMGQVIRAQSGEHEDFSRIAFNIPDAVTWEIQETASGVDVIFSSGEVSTDGIFALIPRTRLRNAVPDGSRVSLEFNCDCQTSSFVFQDRFLVLDIVDADEEGIQPALEATNLPGLPNYREFEDWSVAIKDLQPATEVGEPVDSSQNTLAPELPIAPQESSTLREPEISPDSFVGVLGLPQPIADQQQKVTDFGALDSQIGEAFARALSEGFLEAAASRTAVGQSTDVVEENAAVEEETKSSPTPKQSTETPTTDDLLDAIRITKPNQNLSEALVGRQTNENFDGEVCLPASYFTGFSSIDTDFWEQKMLLGSQLYDDIDNLDDETGIDLAKLLIGHGFGAEGEAILRLLQPEQPDPVLLDLSRLMDGGNVLQKDVWQQQISCAGVSALFGVLATDGFSAGTEYSKESILMSFQSFSLPIRLYLGPRLAQRFVKAGDIRFAEAFNESLVRASQQTSSAAKLSEALLLRATGNIKTAEEALLSLIGERGSVGPMAILELVDLRLQENLAFDKEDARLISSIAFAQRQSADARELQKASVQALTRAGLYFDALEETDRLGTSFDLDNWFSQEITEFASMAEFLSIAFDPTSRELQVDAYVGFSNRLEDLGFGADSEILSEAELRTNEPTAKFQSVVELDDTGSPASILAGAEEILQQTSELTEIISGSLQN